MSPFLNFLTRVVRDQSGPCGVRSPSARPFGRTFSIARASSQFASEHPTEGYLVRRSLVCAVSVAWAHHRPRSHVSCHAGPAGPKARRGGYLVGGRRSTARSASACAQTGCCELCSRAMENACMQIATAHGATWACVLAGFYSVSGVDEVALQRVARSASMPPKPPGAPLPDDA